MKKTIFPLITLLLAGLLLTAGCQTDDKQGKAVETDVLVIGGGGAGLVSAITAAQNGSDVILLEKMPYLGGNTISSATGLTASDTALHLEAGIPFTVEDHIQRTMEVGKELPDEKLVRILAENSNDAFEWLLSLGLSYKLNELEPWWIIPVEGHFGAQMVKAFITEADKYTNLDIRVNTRGTELIVEDGKVVGAKAEDKEGNEIIFRAGAVILATGGFGNAPDLIGEYNPRFAGTHSIMSTAGPTGDGFRMALTAGADTRHMEYYQMRPLARPGYWIRESVISQEGGGILLNKEAARFTSETNTPWDLAETILQQPERAGYIIFDADIFETDNGKNAVSKGGMVQADTIEELAEKLSLNPAAVVAAIEAFNNGEDAFNRTTAGKVTTAPFYGAEVLPSPHYTMAGIAFNENAQALAKNGTAIPGLYIVGELGGGLYGAGRVAGNNTIENVVFGKIAGLHASSLK